MPRVLAVCLAAAALLLVEGPASREARASDDVPLCADYVTDCLGAFDAIATLYVDVAAAPAQFRPSLTAKVDVAASFLVFVPPNPIVPPSPTAPVNALNALSRQAGALGATGLFDYNWPQLQAHTCAASAFFEVATPVDPC